MNQITPAAASAIASLSSIKTGLQNVSSTIVARGGDPFLRMGTDGVWIYGAESIEVQEGSLWAVNTLSLMHGWVSWTDHPGKQANEIVGEVMVPMTVALPPQTELRETGFKWSQQLSVTLKCLNGDDVGEQVLYKTTSTGGINAMKTLLASIMAQLEKDPARIIPVVTLENDSYPHKKYGKTYIPILSIRNWIELTDEAPAAPVRDEPDGDLAEETAAPEPARRRAVAAEQVREPVYEAPEPAAAAAKQPTAADRKAALMAELAALDGTPEPEAPAEAPVRRRRRG